MQQPPVDQQAERIKQAHYQVRLSRRTNPARHSLVTLPAEREQMYPQGSITMLCIVTCTGLTY